MKIIIFVIVAYIINFCNAGTNESSGNRQPQIVIIGAGISGLAAADRLINVYKFENVKIIEALNRIGGRIYPVPFGDGYIQIGAEWLHHRENPIFEMAIKLGMIQGHDVKSDRHDTSYFHFINQDSCELPKRLVHALEHVVDKFNELAGNKFSGYNASSSYGDVMDNLYQEYLASKANEFDAKDVALLNAAYKNLKASTEHLFATNDWHDISIKSFVEPKPNHVDEPVEDIPLGKFGYRLILDEMIRRVPPDAYIELNSHVKVIRYDNDNDTNNQVKIELYDGRVIAADHVIVTCSLGYLKRHANVLFNPPLPQRKSDTIRALGFGTVDKLILIFNESFWRTNETVVQLVKSDLGANSPECDNSPPLPKTDLTQMFEEIFVSTVRPNALIVWIKSQDAPSFENNFNAQSIADVAGKALRKYFGNASIPTPQIKRTAWNKNPLFYGSYSYDSKACDQINCDRTDLSEPLWVFRNNDKVPLIQFAGEATNEDFYATTHGAFFSGEREADRLFNFYKKT